MPIVKASYRHRPIEPVLPGEISNSEYLQLRSYGRFYVTSYRICKEWKLLKIWLQKTYSTKTQIS
jgi:hypothetical protein